MPSRFRPDNIVTLDQEGRGLVAVVNGGPVRDFHPDDVDDLPAGGGYVVADANVWQVRNDRSQSQYCFADVDTRDRFIAELEARGYRARLVSNKHAQTLYVRRQMAQADAVVALYDEVHRQVRAVDGAPIVVPGEPLLGCGTCTSHTTFDGGRRVRDRGDHIDRSFGQRARVVDDFLLLQNAGGYDSAFLDAAVEAVWSHLDRDQRALLNMKKRVARCHPKDRNRLASIVVCTHDPITGELRRHDGAPWGRAFITRRVIGLNGTMRGTGPRTPGNPMRAVLRILGRRSWTAKANKIDRAERAALDACVRAAIRALQAHGTLPAVRAADAPGRDAA